METPTFECYITKENEENFLVEIDCHCGKIHKHGVPKNEIDAPSHRGAHCSKFTDGYYLLLTQKEVNAWTSKKK